MNTRKVVSALAVSAALLLGTSGCSLTHDVASLQHYAPSDGSQIDIGKVKVRNFIYLTKGDGSGKLIGTVVNGGTTDATVSFEYVSFEERVKTDPFELPAGETLDLGATPDNAALDVSVEALPGSNIELWISVNGETGQSLTVPVLDGSLEQYAPYLEN